MLTTEYKTWLADLKQFIRNSQIKVNTQLLKVCWKLGKDLMHEFPSMKGFSVSNLKLCKLKLKVEPFSPAPLADNLPSTDQIKNSFEV